MGVARLLFLSLFLLLLLISLLRPRFLSLTLPEDRFTGVRLIPSEVPRSSRSLERPAPPPPPLPYEELRISPSLERFFDEKEEEEASERELELRLTVLGFSMEVGTVVVVVVDVGKKLGADFFNTEDLSFFFTFLPFHEISLPSVIIIFFKVAPYRFAMTLKSSFGFVSLFVRRSFFLCNISHVDTVIGKNSEIF